MKKYIISLLVVMILLTTGAFTGKPIKIDADKQGNAVPHKWYNFNGVSEADMCDPTMYSPDENDWPDCPPNVGYIYCEILAKPSQVPGEPDLSKIRDERWRPLE